MNNVPTIVPRLRSNTLVKGRNTRTSLGMLPEMMSPIHEKNLDDEEDPVVNLSVEQQQKLEIDQLKAKVEELTKEKIEIHTELNNKINSLENTLKQCQFTVERFKHNTAHFRFYTGFETYKLFSAVLDYLKPDVCNLKYWGSLTKDDEGGSKRGR